MKTQHCPARRVSLIAATLLATLLATASAQAQNITYTAPANTTGNWSTASWTASSGSVPTDWTTTAGDLVQSTGNTTYTVDTDVTIGSVKLNGNGGNFNLLSDGTHTLTVDGTGLSAANQPFADANVGVLVNANGNTSNGSSRALILGNSSAGLTIDMNSSVDIGVASGAGQGVQTWGTITNTNANSTLETLTIRANSTAGSAPSTNASVTIHSTVGGSGSAIAIINAGTGSGNVTFGNSTVGAIGAEVVSITQNSATSKLFLAGNNAAFVGNTLVNAGVLSIGSNYTFAPGTSNQITLDGSASPVAGTDYGQITVTAGTLTLGGALTLDFSSTLTGGATYSLFTKSGTGAISGDFTAVSIAGSYVLSLTETSGVWSGTSNGVTFSLTASTGVLTTTVSAIPEPAAYGVLLGALGLVFAACKRLRRAA